MGEGDLAKGEEEEVVCRCGGVRCGGGWRGGVVVEDWLGGDEGGGCGPGGGGGGDGAEEEVDEEGPVEGCSVWLGEEGGLAGAVEFVRSGWMEGGEGGRSQAYLGTRMLM